MLVKRGYKAMLRIEHLNRIQCLILQIYRWQQKWIPHIQTVCPPGYPNREWMGKLEDMKDILAYMVE